MDWFSLTLLCAFFLASADAVIKHFLSDYRAGELVVVRLVWTALPLCPLLLLKPWPTLPPVFWAYMLILVPMDLGAMWLYMQALRVSPLSHSIPYLAFTPVFSTVTARWLLGEQVAPTAMLGILAVTAGAYMLNAEHIRGRGWLGWIAPLRFIVSEPGPRLMLAVALIYSFTSTLSKAVLHLVPAWFLAPFYFTLLGAVALGLAAVRAPAPAFRLLWRRPGVYLLIGIFMAGMSLTHFLAMEKVQVAYMIAVKRSSLLFSIVYGAWLFGEKRLWQHLAAGAVMVAGIILIAAS